MKAKSKLRFWFDEAGDVLDISIGKPRAAVSKELEDDIVVRINPRTKKVVGFTILNFTERFRHAKSAKGIYTPIEAKMSLA